MSPRPSVHEISIEARGLRFPALCAGPLAGPLVLCLHGFPDDWRSFRHQLSALAGAGYRAVAPALRGYAPSCLPPPRECHALEAALDAIALVRALGASRAHLIGHDWGAVAGYLAAARSPASFRSLCTLAVPHPLALLRALPRVPAQALRSWYVLFMQLPLAPELLAARDFALLERLWRAWSPDFTPPAGELALLKQTFRRPGVTQAAVAYYRNLLAPLSPAARDARALLALRSEVPTLALTGERDGCIDTRSFAPSLHEGMFADLAIERFAGVGHFLHQEAPQLLNPRLLAWLADH